ncbi:MAG: AAA family ATPase, partial [Rickettsiales bacterium]|nr:AAA family ATPase [Rickettsiales bacterium]
MTNIKDLCDYYLHCILYDSLSIYLPLTNIGKDFIKLSDVPSDINAEIMTNEGYDYIRNAYFNSKNKKNLYIGYLTTVSNNKIIPLFLFPIIRKNGSFQCNLTEPIINTAFIKKITFLNGFQLALEIINLHGDLDTKNLHFNEVLKKIGQIRPNYSFNTEIIFLSTEISNFTKGLENELTELKTSIDYQNTSLKYLLNMNGGTNTKRTSILEDNIREFVPMNKEQFNSIYSSFNNDLTLIYGPPGTGKSQVVINILLNAIINNKKILFCSKNNKAIEVVKEKMKKITQGNVLLDLGDITSTANFFHQILTFNGAIPQNLSINGNEYKHCIDKIKEIEGEEEKIIKLRNEIDNFDKREISVYRGNFNDDIFLNLKKLDYNSSFEELEKIEDYIFKYNEDKNSFFLLKCFKIKKIFRLLKCRKNVFKIVKDIGYNGNIYKNLKIINDLLQQGERIKKYFNDLQKLSNEKSLYDLQKQKMNIDHRKNQIVSDYLYKFLRNRQSDLMKQRGNLANFITLLNFIIKGPTPQQRKDFCKNILNFNNFCYCITSLSSSH